MCKSNKMNGWAKHSAFHHYGFGKIRDEIHAAIDKREIE